MIYIINVLLLFCLALVTPDLVAARTVPATASAAEVSLLAATTESGAAMAGAPDEKSMLVGVGGMGNLPGLPAVCNSYGGSFSNNSAGVFTRVTQPLSGVGGVGNASGIPLASLDGSPAAAPQSAPWLRVCRGPT